MHLEQFIAFSFLFLGAISKTYFHETFDEGFESRWTYSEDPSVTHGVFEHVAKAHCDVGDRAIKSANDSAYYHISAPLSEPLDTRAVPLYFQFVAQYAQDIDCGGAYLKLFADLDPRSLTGKSPYVVMIGPDVCGYSTKLVQFLVAHQGEYFPIKDKLAFEVNKHPHLVSMYLGVDKTFSISLDNVVLKSGKLKEHFNYLQPETIDDPEDKKPEDWEDNPTMDDPEDVKPEDWDERKEVSDPEAKKPDNWDDETDGQWEPDLIKNPDYKGEWTPKQIPNPNYKGVWAPKQIPNPKYKDDNTFGEFIITHVGFDLWTVKSGTMFDEIYITDDKDEAEKHAKEVMATIEQVVEKLKKEAADKPTPESPISFGSQEDVDGASSEDAEESDEDSDEPGEAKAEHEDL